MNREFRFHKGARIALRVVGVLCLLLVVAAPVGLWILWRVSRAKLSITPGGVSASALTTVDFEFAEVERLGVCKVPIVARGIGGALARYKVGGDAGINLCVMLRNKKKRQITVSMYEDYQTALDAVSTAVGRPYEELSIGLLGIKRPEVRAAA